MAPPPTSDAEVMRYILDDLTKRLAETAARFEAAMGRLDSTYVRKDVYDLDRQNAAATVLASDAALRVTATDLTRRLDSMDETRTWLLRIVVGTGLTAVISAAVAAFATAGGH